MADNNQVWAVSTPGAPHNAILARQAAFATTGGVTGIVAGSKPGVGLTPGVPMSVRLKPCSVVAASTYAGARRESYSFDVPESVDVAVATTGSSARTDVIAFVITDPVLEARDIMELDQYGQPIEGSTGIDPRDHDYWSAVRFASVPASARKSPEDFRQWAQARPEVKGPVIPYAIVTQAANSVGLEGKVKPFFETVMARKDTITIDHPPTYEASTVLGPYTSYRDLGPLINFDVPWWATRAHLKATINGVSVRRTGAGIRKGKISGLSMGRSMRQYNYYEESSSSWDRMDFTVFGNISVRASERGTTQSFRFRVTNENANQYMIVAPSRTHIFLEVTFYEDPNAVDNSDPEDA